MVLSLLFVISCEKALDVPAINVVSDYEVGYESGNYSLLYSIYNASDELELTVKTDADWINNISVSSSEINFSVSENLSDSKRYAVIQLIYPDAEIVEVTIKQDGCTSTDLSSAGSANSYIVSEAGIYSFRLLKGNSSKPVRDVSSVEVLWESFGTDEKPNVGDLISKVIINGKYVVFSTSETFREGNALLAVKDESGKILWSWHIWMTDIPEDQVYNYGAGTMMDRNLGAVSSTPGDVGSLGLLYQWGRKDPFIGSSSISESIPAACTIEWPDVVPSDKETGTIEYAISNPTVFIVVKGSNTDWLYDGAYLENDPRWLPQKTMYDPCPPGYHVPEGDFWINAFSLSSPFDGDIDTVNKGFDFGSSSRYKLTEAKTCWYPLSGLYNNFDERMFNVGIMGNYMACTVRGTDADGFSINIAGPVYPVVVQYSRAYGRAIRCMKE